MSLYLLCLYSGIYISETYFIAIEEVVNMYVWPLGDLYLLLVFKFFLRLDWPLSQYWSWEFIIDVQHNGKFYTEMLSPSMDVTSFLWLNLNWNTMADVWRSLFYHFEWKSSLNYSDWWDLPALVNVASVGLW